MAHFEVNSKGEARDTLEVKRLAMLSKLEDLKNNSGRVANPDREEYWESIKGGFESWNEDELNNLVSDRDLRQRVLKLEEGQKILSLARDVYRNLLKVRLQQLKDEIQDIEEKMREKRKKIREILTTPTSEFADSDVESIRKAKERVIKLNSTELDETIWKGLVQDIKEVKKQMEKLNES